MSYDVMIIDDSDFQRKLTELMVKSRQPAPQVISFESATGALAFLHTLKVHADPFPKVIFLDIHMPVMDGFDFLDKYMEFPPQFRDRCKVIMLSSTDAQADHDRMDEYPVIYKFLPKPMSGEALEKISALWKDNKNETDLVLVP